MLGAQKKCTTCTFSYKSCICIEQYVVNLSREANDCSHLLETLEQRITAGLEGRATPR